MGDRKSTQCSTGISRKNVEGVLLIAENDAFNKTNPTIYAKVDTPKKISILNKDVRRHDFIVDELNINTAYLSMQQSFTTAIASSTRDI